MLKILNKNIFSILLLFFILLFLYLFFFNEAFFLWAFERHQNTLSWFIRPLILIPFCYFAYKKSLNWILVTVLALFTSMFWFPIPNEINPQVIDFLTMEKEFLTSWINIEKIIFSFIILFNFYFLVFSFVTKSIKLWIFIALLAAVWKSLWSVFMTEWWISVIPFALLWFLLLLFSIYIYVKFFNKNK